MNFEVGEFYEYVYTSVISNKEFRYIVRCDSCININYYSLTVIFSNDFDLPNYKGWYDTDSSIKNYKKL